MELIPVVGRGPALLDPLEVEDMVSGQACCRGDVLTKAGMGVTARPARLLSFL